MLVQYESDDFLNSWRFQFGYLVDPEDGYGKVYTKVGSCIENMEDLIVIAREL